MEFRKFYGEQLDSHGRQPRATATGDSHGRRGRATATGDSHGRQPRATGPGDGAGRRGRATGPGDGEQLDSAQDRAGITRTNRGIVTTVATVTTGKCSLLPINRQIIRATAPSDCRNCAAHFFCADSTEYRGRVDTRQPRAT